MDEYKLGSSTTTDEYAYIAKKGLTKRLVGELSASKNEPEWMREERLKALTIYESLTTPEWGADLSELKWDEIHYYLKSV